MNLNDVHRGVRRFKRRKRIGCGIGSGRGKTATRGHKGAKARAGFSQHPTFQGGTMPMVRRIPKRGFNNAFALRVQTVNVGDLEILYDADGHVSPESLAATPIAQHRYDVLKILGDGELTKKLTVSAHRFSATAKAKIEQAGGTVVVLPGPTPVSEKQAAAKALARSGS